jgi:hypothetical protein
MEVAGDALAILKNRPVADALLEPRILDRHPSGSGERDHHLLVRSGEAVSPARRYRRERRRGRRC